MTYVCPRWYENIDWNDGDELREIYNERECSYWGNATAYLDQEGYVEETHFDGGDVFCGEHDDARCYDERDPYSAAQEHFLDNTNAHICPEDDTLYHTEEGLLAHQDEENAGDDTPHELPTPPPIVTSSTCQREHPALTQQQRITIQNHIARLRNNPYGYVGLLVPSLGTTEPGILNCSRNDEYSIRQWLNSWPNHFYLSLNDPHITQAGTTSHAAWN